MQNDLLSEILAFCERHGMAKTTFGLRALNNKAFVSGLEGGRDVLSSTVKRVRSFMAGIDAGSAQ